MIPEVRRTTPEATVTIRICFSFLFISAQHFSLLRDKRVEIITVIMVRAAMNTGMNFFMSSPG